MYNGGFISWYVLGYVLVPLFDHITRVPEKFSSKSHEHTITIAGIFFPGADRGGREWKKKGKLPTYTHQGEKCTFGPMPRTRVCKIVHDKGFCIRGSANDPKRRKMTKLYARSPVEQPWWYTYTIMLVCGRAVVAPCSCPTICITTLESEMVASWNLIRLFMTCSIRFSSLYYIIECVQSERTFYREYRIV